MGYGKYVNLLFIAAGALVWFLLGHYTDVLLGYFQLGRRMGVGAEYIRHLFPIVMGLGTFAFLRGNTKVHNFVTDALNELVRVVFPGPKEVRVGTIVVIITVLASGAFLGVVDMGFTSFIQTLIGA